MHFNSDDQLYYLFLTFNKIELDKHDIETLYKLGYCPNCLFKFKNKIINDKEIEYINTKNWDEFLDKYPMKLNQCNCIKCSCGLNKNVEIMYDFFDYEEKNPLICLTCRSCEQRKMSFKSVHDNKNLIENNLDSNIVNNNINNNEIICE